MNVTQFPTPEGPPEFMVGPFQKWKVQIQGRVIPKLTAYHDGDKVALVVDERFSASFPREHAYQAAWLIAEALAIGAGYSNLEAETKDHPFAPVGMELSSLPLPDAT